jgi:anti-sigma factor RsiW
MRPENDLACRELVELLTDYLEGSLPPAERSRLEHHLAKCDGCSAYLEQIRTVIRLAGRLTEQTIPVEGRDELMRVFRAWKSSR